MIVLQGYGSTLMVTQGYLGGDVVVDDVRGCVHLASRTTGLTLDSRESTSMSLYSRAAFTVSLDSEAC